MQSVDVASICVMLPVSRASRLLLSSSDTSAGQRFQPHNRTPEAGSLFRVDGGVHDSYTFKCGLVGYFTSPGMTPDRRDRRLLVSPPKYTGKAG